MAVLPPSTDFGLNSSAVPILTYPLTGNEVYTVDTQLTQGQNPNMGLVTTSMQAGFSRAAVALTYAATVTLDPTLWSFATITLTGAVTFANPTTLVSGQKFEVEIVQDGTGTRVATWGSLFKFPGGTKTLSTAAGSIDKISCVYDGTIILTNLSLAYA